MDKQVGLVLIENDVTEKIDRHRGVLTRVEFIDLCIDYCFGIERSIDFLSGRSRTADIRSEGSHTANIRSETSRMAGILSETSRAAGVRSERSRAAGVRSERSRTADIHGERGRAVRPAPVLRKPDRTSYVSKEEFQEFSSGIKHLMEVALELFVAFDIEKRTTKPAADEGYQQRVDISKRVQELIREKTRKPEKVDLPQAYCVKCKKMVDIQNPEKVVLENGTPALRGTCPFSGTPVFRFVKKETVRE